VDEPVKESSKTVRRVKTDTTLKRKHLDEELDAESSGNAKRIKSDSPKYVPILSIPFHSEYHCHPVLE